MWTQAGTALGMFAFVPLGDMLPRRRLIVFMCFAIALAAILMATAPNVQLLEVAAFVVGVTTIVPHLILPFAAKLASPERRGHVVGMVLGGLLTGILLARVASG
jgi:predicted MFS family arabinose efflux permease